MSFDGFETRSAPTAVPDPFFTELLSQIDHLGELKLSLYVIWRQARQEGPHPFFRRSELAADELFMAGLGEEPELQGRTLDQALKRAVERGTFLRSESRETEPIYLLNSPKGRATLKGLESGRWSPERETTQTIRLAEGRPNIFQLYEKNIGPLTPILADTLRDAEAEYQPDWIEEAIRIALENNVRKWSYIDAILKSWQEKGRHDRKDRQESEKNRRKYVEGEFSDFIES